MSVISHSTQAWRHATARRAAFVGWGSFAVAYGFALLVVALT
jgi:hypothetical protein